MNHRILKVSIVQAGYQMRKIIRLELTAALLLQFPMARRDCGTACVIPGTDVACSQLGPETLSNASEAATRT